MNGELYSSIPSSMTSAKGKDHLSTQNENPAHSLTAAAAMMTQFKEPDLRT